MLNDAPLRMDLAAFERAAARHPPGFRAAVLAKATVAGDTLSVPWADYDAAVAAWPLNAKPRLPLGAAVDAIRAAKAASGCYDKDGRVIPGSPCAKKQAQK